MVVDADLRPPITHRLRRGHWMAIDAVVGLLLAVAIVATGRRLGDPTSVRFVWVFGVAPFRFDGGRMGFLIAGAPSAELFDDRKLKILAGLADQSKLAIAGAR